MPDIDVSITPESSPVAPAIEPVAEVSADPVKAAIASGDHVEMNRLMNERRMDRKQGKTPTPTPSPVASAATLPVTKPDSGAGATPQEPATEPQPGSKEYNFREVVADRDRWKTEAQKTEARLQALERRPAEPVRPVETQKPLDIPFNEPRPDWNRILEESQTIDEANAKHATAMDEWMARRDAARDREIQSHTRRSLDAETERGRLVGLATAIKDKVEALSKMEGFSDLPELYRESASPYTDTMLQFYATDEHGARVMHYLILNPGQAQEVTMLPVKLQKTRLGELRDALVKAKATAPTKQTTDAPGPIRRAVTGRTEAPLEPLKAARDEGQKTGNWAKFNALMNDRKRQKMGLGA